MCKQTTYFFRAQFARKHWDYGFFVYPGALENMDCGALLQEFIDDVRDGIYNESLKDAGLIKLDTHTLFPSVHGWKFILYSYVGMNAKPEAIIQIDD